jgi:hypothetical protein
MYGCLQMDSLKEALDWVIIMMERKVDRVKALFELVLQPKGSLSPEKVMKLKLDVVGEMDHLIHGSL